MLPGLWHWQKNSWKNLFSYVGPGFLVSIAYIDPGNCKIKQIHFHSVWLSISLLPLVYPLTFSLGTSCSWDGSTGWSTVQIWGVPYFYLFFPLVCYFFLSFFFVSYAYHISHLKYQILLIDLLPFSYASHAYLYLRIMIILFLSQLLWIILVASCAALIIQSLAARLGVVTGWYFDPCNNYIC